MKNLINQRKKTNHFLFFFFLAVLFIFSRSLVLASDINVTATVTVYDGEAPSVPILIEPVDGDYLGDNTPTFSWYESTDNIAMSHYVFYLDGIILYNNIPLIDEDNIYYTTTYDSLNGIYTLTPKNAFSDDAHTWKIVAVDSFDLTAASDIWDFTIDTLAPSFILKKIGDTDVNISAADISSVPTDPIIIFQNDATANEPILIANGEANSTVNLFVIIPDDPTQNFVTTIDANGYYELQLGILPRDTDIRLDFVIVDAVGHVSVLEKVYFRISLQYWPTATATATSTVSPTDTPTATITPSGSKTPVPSKTIKPSGTIKISTTLTPTKPLTPTPTGIIPIIPPKEIIHEISSELVEQLPNSTADSIRAFLNSSLWKSLSSILPILVLFLFYILSFFILLSKFFLDFSLILVNRILTLMIPPFFKAKKNLVFEYRETLVSPLVKVELLSDEEKVIDFAITNLDGNFDDLSYPDEKHWQLRVKDDNFYYPIGDKKPSQLEFWQFYQGQVFNEDNYHKQAILIPTLRASGQVKLPFFERLRIFVLYLLDYPIWFIISSLLFALVFSMRYASAYNFIALGFYVFMLIYKLSQAASRKSKLVLGAEMTGDKQLYDNLVLSLADEDNQQVISSIMPFEFSKSKEIKHAYKKVIVTAFSKNYALENNDSLVNSQTFNLISKQQEITLKIKLI